MIVINHEKLWSMSKYIYNLDDTKKGNPYFNCGSSRLTGNEQANTDKF